jgi:hypothetical protein
MGEGGAGGEEEPPDEAVACYSGSEATRGVGICRDGVSYGDGVCAGEVTPAPEACNQEDDDCDGEVDEDFGSSSCGVGACRTSVQACVGGVVQECSYTSPAPGDACNGIDDDCDGGVDEDCAACVRVSLTGDDAAGAASNGVTPFRNVQAAIDFAAAAPNAPKHVCIAAGASCAEGTTATYAGPGGAPLTMRNGVSVSGKYESTGWTRCANDAAVTTVLAPATAEGVLFPASIESRTVLFAVSVTRASVEGAAGVTVDGARNVVVASVAVSGAVSGEYSYGVSLKNGAEAHLFRSTVDGGTGSVESIGVAVTGARVLIEESTVSGKNGSETGASVGVLFDSAAGSRLAASTVVASNASRELNVTGVLITGDARGVVVDHSRVTAIHPKGRFSPTAVGVALYDCAAGTPWLTSNDIRTAGALDDDLLAFGIRAVACYPSIDQNTRIGVYRSGNYSDDAVAVTVACEGEGTDEGCTVAGNRTLEGESWRGGSINNVVCLNGGCSRVSRNTILGRRWSSGGPPINVDLGADCQSPACGRHVSGISGGRFIDHNFVEAGCSATFDGISGGNRVLGNVVRGHHMDFCFRARPEDLPTPPSAGETGVSGGAYYDLNDVHVAQTWDLLAGRAYTAALLSGYVYRQNVFTVGWYLMPVVVEGRTPRRFEQNHLDGVDELYFDIETGRRLTTAAEVNALDDMISFGNTD